MSKFCLCMTRSCFWHDGVSWWQLNFDHMYIAGCTKGNLPKSFLLEEPFFFWFENNNIWQMWNILGENFCTNNILMLHNHVQYYKLSLLAFLCISNWNKWLHCSSYPFSFIIADGCYLINDWNCQNTYNATLLPNIFGLTDVDVIRAQLYGLLNQILNPYSVPAVCREPVRELSCGMMYPKCENGSTQQICRNSCQGMYRNCWGIGCSCWWRSCKDLRRCLQEPLHMAGALY